MYETDQKISRFSFLYSMEEWLKDRADRFDIEELTQSLYESVPVLKYLDWNIRNISRGKAETMLPLNVASTNQLATHQAALILLAADYTGGLALSTLFHKIPVIGIHPQENDLGAYICGGKAKIKWHYPSCDDLVCRAEIPEDNWERIVKRFFNGNKIIVTLPVKMFNGDKLVAKADFTYWAQDSYSLCTRTFKD